MPSYLSPGVYVEEVSSGTKPIAGVGTSVGGFVGITVKGTPNQAVLATNWTQFVREFGDFRSDAYLAYAVYGFFAEGGSSCYVVRVIGDGAVAATLKLPNLLDITATSVGVWGNKVVVKIEDPSDKDITTTHFKFTVTFSGTEEVYDNLSCADIATKVNGVSNLITISVSDTSGRPTNNADGVSLAGGSEGAALNINSFLGTEDKKDGLHAFDIVDEVNIIAVPDQAGDRAFILEALNYCKVRKDCFFVADPPQGLDPSAVKAFKNGTGTYSGNAFNSSFGALYYPWVYVNDPLTGASKLVPPSGVVAGTYAYTDSTRGVHKAPAGITEGYLDSVVGVELILTKGENDLLNPIGINAIRSLPAGICIWGTRTLSADAEWQYLNVRRLFLYLEESIDEGTQWVVFEPNDQILWGKVKRNISAFLTRVWRDGALFGSTADEAFYVKVDEENNPPATRDVGQLIIEVGVAPVKPAEFVVIRISQKTLTK